ncbi:MAG: hypothetical protein ABIH00_08285 [Armatimonadota bacterium]
MKPDLTFKKNKQKGMVFISLVILLFMVIVIYIGVQHTCVNTNLIRTGMHHSENKSNLAAASGIEYVASCIEEDYTWNQDPSSYSNRTIEKVCGSNRIIIKEKDGLIEGRIESISNPAEYSTFCVSFVPTSKIKYLSYNRIDKPATDQDPRMKNTDLQTTRAVVPENGVLLVAKGVHRNQVSYIESEYLLAGHGEADAPAIASKQIWMDMNKEASPDFTVDAAGGRPPQIYSGYRYDNELEKSIKILNENGNIDFNGGEIKTFGNYYSVDAKNLNPSKVENMVKTNVQKVIPELTLEKVKEVQLAKNTNPISLKAGDYCMISNNKGTYSIRYTDGSTVEVYDPGAGNIPTFGDRRLEGMRIEGTKLYIERPQRLTPANNNYKHLTIRGDASLPSRVKVIMDGTEANQPYILNELDGLDSSITISGEFSGYGGVFTNGDLTFEGKCMKNATPDNGVSIFAGGKITLKDISKQDQDTSGFSEKFVELAGAFCNHILYSRKNSESEIKNFFNEYIRGSKVFQRNTASRRNKIISFKDYLIEHSIISSDSNDFNLFMAWLSHDFEIEDDDSIFYGLIYSKGAFVSEISGKFSLVGSIIVNSEDSAGISGGYILFNNSKGVSFIYDPKYLNIFSALFKNCKLEYKFSNRL